MQLDIDFIILCPNKNKLDLKNTVNSIRWSNKENSQITCVVGQNCSKSEQQELEQFCPVVVGEDTITSLINKGLKEAKRPWVFILYSGSRLRTNLQKKLGYFVNQDKDILFPIIEGKTNFVDGSSNGILLNKDVFNKIGDFPIMKSTEVSNDFEIAKLLWATNAIEHGCQFKAIAGIRLN